MSALSEKLAAEGRRYSHELAGQCYISGIEYRASGNSELADAYDQLTEELQTFAQIEVNGEGDSNAVLDRCLVLVTKIEWLRGRAGLPPDGRWYDWIRMQIYDVNGLLDQE